METTPPHAFIKMIVSKSDEGFAQIILHAIELFIMPLMKAF
jgi:hypothetical protein